MVCKVDTWTSIVGKSPWSTLEEWILGPQVQPKHSSSQGTLYAREGYGTICSVVNSSLHWPLLVLFNAFFAHWSIKASIKKNPLLLISKGL